MARTRVFLAVDIGDEIRKSAVALQQKLTRSGLSLKWTESAGMHITLLFLGEVDDRRLLDVFRAVKTVADREPPFTVGVSGMGAFPTVRRPKVLWAGVTEGSAQLTRLAAGIEEQLIDRGLYRKEERAYTPHLTLGRVAGESEGQALAAEMPKHSAWVGGTAVVNEVLLFSSDLRPDGPEYVVLGRSSLSGIAPRIDSSCSPARGVKKSTDRRP